jgi:CheY-like chemotaxis protein
VAWGTSWLDLQPSLRLGWASTKVCWTHLCNTGRALSAGSSVKDGGAITCPNSQWGSTITGVKRPQCTGPPCACGVTTERAIQRREPEWRRGFLSSMMGSIAGIYSVRSYAPIQPIWAADGIQALSEARMHQPRVILLDLGLPGGDGFVVLERLKSNRLVSAIPVIVVTAQAPAAAEQKARECGAVASLQKPVKANELIATI